MSMCKSPAAAIRVRKRRIRGVTMVEVLIGAVISSTTLIAAVGCFLAASQSVIKGTAAIDADNAAQNTVAFINSELKEALNVQIGVDGSSVTYSKPMMDSTGIYAMPLQSDGVTRRIELVDGNLRLVQGSSIRILCRGVLTSDPNTNAAYRIFSAPPATVVRRITFTLVTQRAGNSTENRLARLRQNVFIRNVPETTR